MNTLNPNHIPALIPTRKREIMIISKDLEALLLTAKSAAVMRKMLFNNRQFFLWIRAKRLRTKVRRATLEDVKDIKALNVYSSTAENSPLQQKCTQMVLNSKYQSPLIRNFSFSVADRID